MNTMRVQFYDEPVVRPERAGCRIAPERRLVIMIGVLGEQPGDWRVAVRPATLADTEAHPAEYQAYLAGDELGEIPPAPEPQTRRGALFAKIIDLKRRLLELNSRIDAAPAAYRDRAAYRERARLIDAYAAAYVAYRAA